MSTATIEAPSAAVATPETAKPTQDEVVQSLLKPQVKNQPNVRPSPKVEVPKQDEKPAESKPQETLKPTDAEKNFAALRQKAEEAEKRAKEREDALTAREAEYKRLTEEYEAFKRNPVPKEYEEKLTAAEKRAQEMQAQLRAADLNRDPDFQRKYADGIKTALESMQQALIRAGNDPKDVQKAVANWDEAQFAEWAESLPLSEKMKFNAGYMRAVELDTQRTQELQNAEVSWGELQKSRQAEAERQQKARVENLRGEKKSVLEELSSTQDIFKNDADLQKEVGILLDRAAGLEGERLPSKEIMKSLAQSHVLSRHFQRVEKEKTELATELETVKKTLAERDEFIKNLNGSTPTISPTIGKPAAAPDDAFITSLLRPKIKH